MASGEAVLSVAWLEPDNSSGPSGVQMAAVPDGDGFVLSGPKRHVPYASSADRHLAALKEILDDEEPEYSC